MPVDWKVYYDGGGTFSSADGSPELAPALGVLLIGLADPSTGRFLLSGKDYYWWEHGRWWGGDHFGLFDYLARPGWRRVLFGRTVPDSVWNQAVGVAQDDPELPVRSATSKRELRGRP